MAINQEVELRGVLQAFQYKTLKKKLTKISLRHEKDNKISYFFVWSKGIFKINDEVSKRVGKISMKVGDEARGSLREYEVLFERKCIVAFLSICKELGFRKFHKVEQLRENFFLANDVEIALKYTPDFKYHFEIEYIGTKLKSEQDIKKYLESVCDKFDMVPLNQRALKQRIQEIKRKHKLIILKK